MGKFLGYVEALPFISKAPLVGQDRLVKAQVALRKKHTPSLDLYRMLKESASRRRLILTLPWIVEFCSVQDPVAMQLPFYKKLFTLMVKIYKRQLCIKDEVILPQPQAKADPLGKKRAVLVTMETSTNSGRNVKMTRFNAYFLCVHLGWLFEHQNFPRELFITPMGPAR